MAAQIDPIFTPSEFGDHQVPGIWRYILPQSIENCFVPREKKASCHSCPKIVTHGYRPDYRCCTYHPKVPNYSLGLALVAGGEGGEIVRQLAASGYLTPEGMVATPQRWSYYLADVQDDLFGKSKDVLCPFLLPDSGGCSIYAFRNGVCSTFFCHSDFGDQGKKFWESVQTLVVQCELALGQWVMDELGIPAKAYFQTVDSFADRVGTITAEDGQAWSLVAREILWGPWFGRELEYFEAAAKLVSDHRHLLWDIANRTEIYEAVNFDRAAMEVIPTRLHQQISEDDFTPGDTIPPAKLLKAMMKERNRLTAFPSGRLMLSTKATIIENRFDSPEAKHYQQYSHIVRLKICKGQTEDFYVSDATANFLRQFSEAQNLNFALLTNLQTLISDDVCAFISEWSQKKILIPAL